MKTDSQLQSDVMAELRWEPRVDHENIGVSVTNGVVTLTGYVPNYAQKYAAERAAGRVAGVKAIAEEIAVRFATDPGTSDSEIAQRVVNILEWDVTVPEAIKVKVEDGRVTLTGQVGWNYQRDAAARAAGRVHGVRSVSNLVEVRSKLTTSDVRERIVAALKRASAADAGAISVSVDGGTVKLSGRVKGWNERKLAEDAAWAAPGVNKVEDNIIFA